LVFLLICHVVLILIFHVDVGAGNLVVTEFIVNRTEARVFSNYAHLLWLNSFIVGKHDCAFDLTVDHRFQFLKAELSSENFEGGLTLSLRLDDRSDVQLLCVVHARLFEDPFNAAPFAAEAANTENLAPAVDSSTVQDATVLLDDLIVEVARDHGPLSRQAIGGPRFEAASLLLLLKRSLLHLFRDIVELRGHIVLERFESTEVLEGVEDHIESEGVAAKQGKPDTYAILLLPLRLIQVEVAFNRNGR